MTSYETLGKLAGEPLDDRHRVADTVEKIRVTERNVPGARCDLRANVSHDDVDGDDAEAAVVDRHDRTVAAPVLAATARLGVSGRPALAAPLQRRVLRERRQSAAIRHEEVHAWNAPSAGTCRRASDVCSGASGTDGGSGRVGDRLDKRILELAPNDRRYALLTEHRRVKRGIQAVGDQPRARVERAHPGDHRHRQPRGRVHRKKECDRYRPPHDVFAEPLLRQVGADDIDASRPERGRGRREPEGLSPEVIRGDEQNHTGIVARDCHMLYAMNAPGVDDRGFFGHPRGLSTLFFTEMWERFSYYGMRAFLILYMVTPVAGGGLGFSDPDAASIYGTYTGSVWGAAILGGIIADRFLGQ